MHLDPYDKNHVCTMLLTAAAQITAVSVITRNDSRMRFAEMLEAFALGYAAANECDTLEVSKKGEEVLNIY